MGREAGETGPCQPHRLPARPQLLLGRSPRSAHAAPPRSPAAERTNPSHHSAAQRRTRVQQAHARVQVDARQRVRRLGPLLLRLVQRSQLLADGGHLACAVGWVTAAGRWVDSGEAGGRLGRGRMSRALLSSAGTPSSPAGWAVRNQNQKKASAVIIDESAPAPHTTPRAAAPSPARCTWQARPGGHDLG